MKVAVESIGFRSIRGRCLKLNHFIQKAMVTSIQICLRIKLVLPLSKINNNRSRGYEKRIILLSEAWSLIPASL